MKAFIAIAAVLFSISAQAGSLRSECENAYYATGYVKLHQYTAIVTWSEVSDIAHERLENIIFDKFEVISVKEVEGKSIYKIKESSKAKPYQYEGLIEQLKEIPTRVSCTYDV
jgi:hypothetical protein